jgi:hypothetical protein
MPDRSGEPLLFLITTGGPWHLSSHSFLAKPVCVNQIGFVTYSDKHTPLCLALLIVGLLECFSTASGGSLVINGQEQQAIAIWVITAILNVISTVGQLCRAVSSHTN